MKAQKIKVLYFTHPTAFNIFGGAEIQILKTKEYLEKLPGDFIKIKLFDSFHDNIDDYDIIHVFQMSPECLSFFKLAKLKGKKTILSPIYWEQPTTIWEKIGPLSLARFYSNLKIYRVFTSRELYPYKDFLEIADIILPNSNMEASLLANSFKVNVEKFFVVPNGVDRRFYEAKPDFFIKKYGVDDFILYVGKIEPRKNVLNLLKVCRDINIPTVVIGNCQPFQNWYFLECKKIIDSSHNILLVDSVPHGSEELCSAYAAAKVFVLPSWYETPGLAALEAGLAGCNLVITSRGSTIEYFKDYAWYVNPESIVDLRKKILEAYAHPKSPELKNHVFRHYIWEIVAEKTLQAYRLAYNK